MKRVNIDTVILGQLRAALIGEIVANDGVSLERLIADKVASVKSFKHIGNYVFEIVVGRNLSKFWIYTAPVDEEGQQILIEDIV